MTEVKQKTAVGKFLQNVGLPILRAGFKQIPVIGTPIAEMVTNLTQPKGEKKKHSNLSMAVQAGIALAIILDLTMNKGANIEAILKVIGMFPEACEVAPTV